MVRRFSMVALSTLAVLCTAAVASAQQPTAPQYGGAPAHVSFVEGSVTLEREGRIDEAPGNMPLLSGDRLRTRAGRVEVLFGDGSTLHLDQDTTLDLQSDELVRLIGGRVRLSIPGPSREIRYRIDTETGWAQIADAGEYRATFLQNELEIAVLRGRAELVNEDGRTPLRAGERAFARANAAPSYAYVFNSAAWDAFDRWSEARRSERLGLSTQYLPEEVQPYAASFDRNGAWRYEASYGYVWYPRVNVGWRPYYHGRWTTLHHYGVTWVSGDPWGWPTHHYGRWGFNAGAWFWIPGRTWGPAWVSWAYAPGYVSWCPLGWNNRPLVAVNVYAGYDPWRVWTVVPHRYFGHGYVHRNVVAGHHIDYRTRGAFVYADRAPGVLGYAAPRASVAPIQVAGTRPSRSSTPLLTNRSAASAQTNRSASAAAAIPERAASRSFAARRDGSVADPNAVTPETARERAVPSRPMVRSERGFAPESRPPDAGGPQTPSRTFARPADQPQYQPPDRSATPGNRSSDLSIYRREDGYRANPNTYAPSGRAAPRAEPRGGESTPGRPAYGQPPTYSAPPSYGPPRSAGGNEGSRSAPAASRPAAPGGGDRSAPGAGDRSGPGGGDRSAPRTDGSRPSGGAPNRGTARARGGR